MRVVVVGSINTDLVVRVRNFPVPGETIYGERFDTYAGGKGANQAAAAAKLGGEVSMLGAIGDDAYSQQRLSDLEHSGVDVSQILTRDDTAGGVAVIQVDAQGENQIVVVPGANGTVTAQDVEHVLPKMLNEGDLMLAQLELPMDTVRMALEVARERGARTLVNTAPIVDGAEELLNLVDILIVNEIEAGQLLKRDPIDVSEAGQAGADLLRAGPSVVFTTLGSHGAVVNEGNCAQQIRAPEVDVVDTTGAGDATVGAFATALAQGRDTMAAARFAVFAGSFAVQKPGAQPAQPTLAELDEFIHASAGD